MLGPGRLGPPRLGGGGVRDTAARRPGCSRPRGGGRPGSCSRHPCPLQAPPAPEQLKTPYFEPSVADGPVSPEEDWRGGGVTHTNGVPGPRVLTPPPRLQAAPRYHELPTLEEPESELGPEPGLADACLDQINPIYDALVLVDDEASAPPRERDPPFFMSRAMYV